MNTENPFAGQGPVMLDIGGDVGALVVTMPPDTEGLEVEIRPVGSRPLPGDHSQAHPHEQGHDHDQASPHRHVAVVARPGKDGPTHTLLYPSLPEGTYELVPMPGEDVALRARVTGGQVTTLRWRAC